VGCGCAHAADIACFTLDVVMVKRAAAVCVCKPGPLGDGPCHMMAADCLG
jgi:hypothetical protein